MGFGIEVGVTVVVGVGVGLEVVANGIGGKETNTSFSLSDTQLASARLARYTGFATKLLSMARRSDIVVLQLHKIGPMFVTPSQPLSTSRG